MLPAARQARQHIFQISLNGVSLRAGQDHVLSLMNASRHAPEAGAVVPHVRIYAGGECHSYTPAPRGKPVRLAAHRQRRLAVRGRAGSDAKLSSALK